VWKVTFPEVSGTSWLGGGTGNLEAYKVYTETN